jgi:fructokinase
MQEKIKAVAKSNPQGFTINIGSGEHVLDGYAVAYEITQDCFDDAGLEKCIEHAKNNGGIVGGWYNSENQRYYYDSIMIIDDVNDAMNQAREEKQIAIFNLSSKEEIRL